MNLKESTRKYILLGALLFIIVGLVSAKVLAKGQDTQFTTEDILYQQVAQLYNEGNYTEASLFMNELLLAQPKSEAVNYLGGLIAANTEEYEQAAILFQKTLDINPYKVEDAMFMLQFGEVLVLAERNEDARIVLVHCQESAWAPESFPEYQNSVADLLAQIETI
ncbi:tetratricopeptide repeat protein [Solibacillus sp. FSL K6-1523]|uniref:tetratricopeptide repeat protein n=1 Tax=Solibacillus sp. FSL K6-1523 TaxID=2921471 RepID=UPI0030F75EAA